MVYRRFYFDGYAVAKAEIGFVAHAVKLSTLARNKEFFDHIFRLPINIPNPNGETVNCSLLDAGPHLAHLYQLASTRHDFKPPLELIPKYWVQACKPILFIEQDRYDNIEIPFRARTKNGDHRDFQGEYTQHATIGNDLTCYIFQYKGHGIRMWACQNGKDLLERNSRALRIFLLRLHAERECLKQVLQNIATERLKVIPKSPGSTILQDYLNLATRRISKLESRTENHSNGTVAQVALESDEYIVPGEREAILQTLRTLDVQYNILQKVERFVNHQIFINEVRIMRDEYNVNQAGAVGPNSHAHDIEFNQIWLDIDAKISLTVLAQELAILRAKMKEVAAEPEHDESIGAVASAERAARNNDGPQVLKHLRDAGKWALDIATGVGVGLAVEALKKALGF